jgi:hypothetical protein
MFHNYRRVLLISSSHEAWELSGESKSSSTTRSCFVEQMVSRIKRASCIFWWAVKKGDLQSKIYFRRAILNRDWYEMDWGEVSRS